MMRNRKGEKNKTGATGELVARKWLINKGYQILADNYQEKWGEIDLIAEKDGLVHFVEVKTVSYETKAALETAKRGWRPEENVHPQKLKRLYRTIETWLARHETVEQWQIDVIAVRLVVSERYASLVYINNIIE